MNDSSWSAETIKELHDRGLNAQKEFLLSEVRRIDEELETQVARWRESLEALRESMKVGDDALKEHISAQYRQLAAALDAQQREADKFTEGVKARFEQVNEFRAALADLGREMATRREFESFVVANRAEREALIDGLTKADAQLVAELSDLRTQVAVGPEALRSLQERADQSVGAQERGKELSQAFVGVGLALAGLFGGTLAAILTHVLK